MNSSFKEIADSLIYYLAKHSTKNKTKYEIFNEWSNSTNLDFRANNQISAWCLDCIQMFMNGVDKNLLNALLDSK